MWQQLKDINNTLGFICIKRVRKAFTLQILELSSARSNRVLTGRDVTGDNILCILQPEPNRGVAFVESRDLSASLFPCRQR